VKPGIQLDMKNPYEQIDAEGNLLDPLGARQGNLNFQNDELHEYNLPRHKNPIEYFKLLHHDLYETEKRYLPNIILTVTKNNEVFLWQENLMNVRFLVFILIELTSIYLCTRFQRLQPVFIF
jgi:hypothetical protein